jgi:hypothetical protein
MSAKRPDPATVARTLTVTASQVLARTFDPQQYPHQHLAVVEAPMLGGPQSVLPTVMAAAETLAAFGWELVNLTLVSDRTLCAVMRRVPRPA